jgi:hypothetical protein
MKSNSPETDSTIDYILAAIVGIALIYILATRTPLP